MPQLDRLPEREALTKIAVKQAGVDASEIDALLRADSSDRQRARAA